MSHPIAYVLFEAPVLPNETALVEVLRQRHPDLRWGVAGLAAKGRTDDPIFIRCGDHLMVVMLMPAPLPYDANLWKRASRSWPEAPDAAGRHRAHLVVSTMGAAENRADIARLTDVESARLTTATVGGLIAVTSGCCAVVWGAGIARSAQMWLEMSRGAFSPYPNYPFKLWIEIVPFQSSQAIGAVTVGLSPSVDREIEFEVDGLEPSLVVERVAGLASYLIEHGAVIKDGDTFGVSEADRIKVHHRASRFNGSLVLAVGSDRPIPSLWKHYPIIPASIARDHPLLIMLTKAGLFDASSPENQIQLRPDHYVSEVRLESYDQGMNGVLSKILTTDAYAEADQKARYALACRDVETAKSVLMRFAKEIGEFQATTRYALTQGDLYMFLPKPLPANSS